MKEEGALLAGEMSVVGPRPEVPKFVDRATPELWDQVLSVKPGIFGPNQIRFRNEGESVNVEDVTIRFGNGETQRARLDQRIESGVVTYRQRGHDGRELHRNDGQHGV